MSDRSTRPILVVDDDRKIVELVRTYLERAGHRVIAADNGSAALAAIEVEEPILVVLDLMLPVIDGLTVLEVVRRRGSIPVIVLSARGTTSDRIEGLRTGADDYLPKPFSPSELVARVERVIARSGVTAPAEDERPLVLDGLVVDRARHRTTVDGRPIPLTATELRLLVAILVADGRVLSRDQLLDAVYGLDATSVLERTIDVLIGRVRDQLGDAADAPRFIVTVRGVGYRAAVVPVAEPSFRS